jgi:hypothetical protein
VILAALAGAAVAGTFLVLSLTGSSERTAFVQRAHKLVGSPPRPKLVHFKTHLSLPNLTALAIKRFEGSGLNEKLPPTPVRSNERALTSSAFPQTQVRGHSGRLRFTRRSLVDAGHADFIAEPDIAVHGRRVMVTWNNGAAFSSDGGRTFTFANPAVVFPPAHEGVVCNPALGLNKGCFCCDQSAVYVPRYDLWVWVLQYWPDDAGNIIRLAVARGDSGFDNHLFQKVDLSPASFGWSNTAWFDYPDTGLTNGNFFLSVNTFDNDRYNGTLVLRIPLTDLAAATPTIAHSFWIKTDNQAAALAAGGHDTMYFASHVDTAKLRLWAWPDSSTDANYYDIDHTPYRYSARAPFSCPRKGGPAGNDWCERRLRSGALTNDDRPTTAWVANGVIGVAWNAQQARANGFPYPYVMVVRINEATKALINQPSIWNRNYAFQYLDVAPNAKGELGGVVVEGGGTDYENCAALSRSAKAGSRSPWEARVVDASDHDPTEAKSGDYLGVSPAGLAGNAWSATCYTIHRARGPQNVGIRFVSFRR